MSLAINHIASKSTLNMVRFNAKIVFCLGQRDLDPLWGHQMSTQFITALPCERRFGSAGEAYLHALILSFSAPLFNSANIYSVGIWAKYRKYSVGDRNTRQRL